MFPASLHLQKRSVQRARYSLANADRHPGWIMLMTLAWLAQQAPAAQTPTDLRPALYTASGALLGVLLTILVQSLNSRLQRRHENQGRAFDLRFEVYVTLFSNLDVLVKAKEAADKLLVSEALDRAKDAQRQLSEQHSRIKEINEEVDRIPDGGTIKEARRVALLAELERAPKEIARLTKERDDAKKLGEKELAELKRHHRIMVKSRNLFRKHVQQLRILSESSTKLHLEAIIEKVYNRETPTSDEYEKFRIAVRKELGIERRSTLGLWLRRAGFKCYIVLVAIDRACIEALVPAMRKIRERHTPTAKDRQDGAASNVDSSADPVGEERPVSTGDAETRATQ